MDRHTSRTSYRTSKLGTGGVGKIAALAALAGIAAGMAGCETDGFMLDPSVVGRWEHTPARVPILTRIASIEGPGDDFVEYSDIRPDDLLPEITEYRIGPGDRLIVIVFDIPDEGRSVPYPVIVDTRGAINLPQLGEINLLGLTVRQAEEVVMNAMRELVANPLASITVEGQRQQRFSVFGGVVAPGPYQIPAADYRLLEALTAAGGFSEAPEFIYIIRQVPLTPAAGAGGIPGPRPTPAAPEQPTPAIPDIDRIIQELVQPPTQPPAQPPAQPRPQGSPGMFSGRQPAAQDPPIDLIEPNAPVRTPAATLPNQARTPPLPAARPQPMAQTPPSPAAGDSAWVFINGQWVRVARPTPAQTAVELQAGQTPPREALMTQRVIRVPVRQLVQGDARVNVVVRPGDVIRVPPTPIGTVYMAGQVVRPGTYNIVQGLTLQRAIVAAGGFSAIAIPERIDITRQVGPEAQATIRLNGRAIFEGTHPDIFLRSNDQINVGTNFWATPLAIIRNGFRATYGFGFLLDRNFGNDVFGAPPDNRIGF